MSQFNLLQLASAFVMLFAIIDPLGSLPIILDLQKKGNVISPWKVSIAALVLMLIFLFAGEWMLRFFNIDIRSFAVAGAIIIFLMALEMVCDIVIFKNNGPQGSASIVPLAFPLFAGPGVMTALISLRAEYDTINIITALILNMVIIFFEIKFTDFIQKRFSESAIYIVRKFFGIILLAISVKLFTTNISILLQ